MLWFLYFVVILYYFISLAVILHYLVCLCAFVTCNKDYLLAYVTFTDGHWQLPFIGPSVDNIKWIFQKRTIVWIVNFKIHFDIISKILGLDTVVFEQFSKVVYMGGATGGCGGQCPPTFGTSGVPGVQGDVQWKWSLLLQQTVFITSDWFSTPLTSRRHVPS